MDSEIGGLPFIGENGHYPRWARGASRWVFQRTTIIIGELGTQMASLHSAEFPPSDQIVVWAPPNRLPIIGNRPSAIHKERQCALNELQRLRLVCYGDDECKQPKPGSSSGSILSNSVVRESGVQPGKWLLLCPLCGGTVGPDVGDVTIELLIHRWHSVGRPPLDHPGAGWNLQPMAAVMDLPKWSEKYQPNYLELAYLGQQMWPDISSMLRAIRERVIS